VLLIQSCSFGQAAGDFAPAGATRAVCPGPDKGLFRKGPLTPNLFNTGLVVLAWALCSPLSFFIKTYFQKDVMLLEEVMPLILDVGLMVTVFLIVFMAARKGFVAAVVDLVGYIVSLIASWLLSGKAAQWCYDNFLRERILKQASSVLREYFSVEDVIENLEQVIEGLPSVLTNTLTFEWEEVSQRLEGAGFSALGLAETFTDSIIAPSVIGLMRWVIFLLMFSLMLFIVHVCSRLLRELRRLPVIGTANSLLGGLVGFVEVILLVFAFTTALHLFFTLTNDSVSWLCSDTVWSTNILSKLYRYNPLLR